MVVTVEFAIYKAPFKSVKAVYGAVIEAMLVFLEIPNISNKH